MTTAAFATGFLALIATATVAGLLFGYWCSVMPALDQVPARTAIAVMRRINVVIVNPPFLAAFLGAAALLPAAAVLAWWTGAGAAAGWFAAAAGLYGIGTFGVTVALNVPLNDALERLSDEPAAPEEEWPAFAGPWNRWHALRTAASVLALACSGLGLAALP